MTVLIERLCEKYRDPFVIEGINRPAVVERGGARWGWIPIFALWHQHSSIYVNEQHRPLGRQKREPGDADYHRKWKADKRGGITKIILFSLSFFFSRGGLFFCYFFEWSRSIIHTWWIAPFKEGDEARARAPYNWTGDFKKEEKERKKKLGPDIVFSLSLPGSTHIDRVPIKRLSPSRNSFKRKRSPPNYDPGREEKRVSSSLTLCERSSK